MTPLHCATHCAKREIAARCSFLVITSLLPHYPLTWHNQHRGNGTSADPQDLSLAHAIKRTAQYNIECSTCLTGSFHTVFLATELSHTISCFMRSLQRACWLGVMVVFWASPWNTRNTSLNGLGILGFMAGDRELRYKCEGVSPEDRCSRLGWEHTRKDTSVQAPSDVMWKSDVIFWIVTKEI